MVDNELITKVRTRNVKSILSNVFTSSGGGTWGSITGTLSSQTDLQTALDAKADDLTNGNGTTANGSAVDLGGTLSSSVLIFSSGAYDYAIQYPNSFRVDDSAGDTFLMDGGDISLNATNLKFKSSSTVGHVWTASGTDGTGGWAASSVAGLTNLASAKSGNYFTNVFQIETESNASFTGGTLRASAFFVTKSITFDRIQTNVTANGGVGCVYRVGIYSDNGSLYPGSLVSGSDAAEYDGASNGVKTSGAVSITLTPGLYWVAVHSNITLTLRGWTTGFVTPLGMTSTATGALPENTYSGVVAYGSLPATYTASHASSNAAVVKLGLRL